MGEGASMRDDGASRGDRSALLGAALALPVLAAIVIGAGAARPPATSDGVWTTPLQIVLGLVGLVVLVVLVLVLRGMEVDGVRPGPPQRRSWARSLVLFALLVVAIVVLPHLGLDPTEPDVGTFTFGAGGGAAPTGEPLPVSPTAVVAGLAALALAAAGGILLLRGGTRGRRPRPQTDTPPDSADDTAGPPSIDGPPDQVVLTAYAAARTEVVHRLGSGEHDPPGRLLRRAEGTPMAAALRVLTEHYLPVRYGRHSATAEDAAAAVAALEQLRAPTASRAGGR